LDAAAEVAQRLGELLLAGNALGHVELAAEALGAVDQGPAVATLVHAAGAPAGRAPPTATRLGAGAGAIVSSVSKPARGLTRQLACLLLKVWSRQAWLQAMQVLISSARPAAALASNAGRAR